MVIFDLVAETDIKEFIQYKYCFYRAKYNEMRKKLRDVNWIKLFEDRTVEEMWVLFKNTIDEVIKTYVPKKRVSRRNKCLWQNWKTRKAMKRRKRKWQKYKESNDIGDWWSYKQARNNVTRELRNARLQFEQKLTTDIKKNQKTFFSYVRSKSRTKDRVGPLKDNNGQVVDDDQKSCDILNSFFSSVYTDENMNNMPEAKQMFY